MLNWIFDLLGWRNNQRDAFYDLSELLKSLFSGKIPVTGILAALFAAVQLFGYSMFKIPVKPYGEEVNLEGYELVVDEDFDGDSLDTDIWYYRGLGAKRDGIHSSSQVEVKDGNMIITAEYLDKDKGEFGEGWYSAAVALNEWYCKGYFEIRCICNPGEGFWSAFWLQSEHSYDLESNGGIGGAEIDIFESMDYKAFLPRYHNSVGQTVYVNGWDDDDENYEKTNRVATGNDIYNQFNTYGLMWTDEEYIFFINGKETFRTSFGKGTSQVPENLIVSLEIPSEIPESIRQNKDYKTQMIVDYVKVYQLAE